MHIVLVITQNNLFPSMTAKSTKEKVEGVEQRTGCWGGLDDDVLAT